MVSTTVRAPGRPARSQRDAPGTTAPIHGRPPSRPPRFTPPRRRGADPRFRRFAIALSVGLHVVLLAVLIVTDAVRLPDFESLLDEPRAMAERVVYLPIGEFPGPRTSASPSAGPIAETPAPILAPPARSGLPAPDMAAPVPAPRPGDGIGSGTGAVAGSVGGEAGDAQAARDRFNRAVDALRPRSLSPLLRDASIDNVRTDEERAALRAYARIRALNDSIMAETEAGRRATDWTWTDEQGRRWGISPGKLHLGGLEIPLPVTTTSSRDRDLTREWQEIQAQAEQGAIDETFDDRVEEIRARRDAERRQE